MAEDRTPVPPLTEEELTAAVRDALYEIRVLDGATIWRVAEDAARRVAARSLPASGDAPHVARDWIAEHDRRYGLPASGDVAPSHPHDGYAYDGCVCVCCLNVRALQVPRGAAPASGDTDPEEVESLLRSFDVECPDCASIPHAEGCRWGGDLSGLLVVNEGDEWTVAASHISSNEGWSRLSEPGDTFEWDGLLTARAVEDRFGWASHGEEAAK